MKSYNSYTSKYFKNPYNFNSGSVNSDLSNALQRALQQNANNLEIDSNRSVLNRVLSPLMLPTYATAGWFDGTFDGTGEGTRTPWKGAWEGIKASNPFGKGYEKGETTFSDVLGTMGWEPKSAIGKFTKGTVGLGLDIALDPTTYLTGGLSAIVKGTGRTGKAVEALAKVGDDLPYMQFDNTVKRLTEKGVNPDLAERFAMKKLDEAVANPQKLTQMTDDIAQEIVSYQSSKRGLLKSSEEIMNEASTFSKEFNRVVGLRNEGRITWGVGNLPFMPKKYQSKVIDLGSDAGLRQLSDTLKISEAYGKLRNFVYGKEIGKLLSTTSPLYKAVHEDPARLWEALEYSQIVAGQKLDKIKGEKEIRDFAQGIKGFTPAETKEIMQLLEDRTIMGKIKEKVQFKDLEQVKSIKKTLEGTLTNSRKALNTLIEKRTIARTWKEALDDDILKERDLYDTMKQLYQKELADIDVQSVKHISELETLVKMYSDEIAEMDARIAKATDGDIGALERLHEASLSERKAFSAHMSNRTQDGKRSAESAPGRKSTNDLKDALSYHVYGEQGHFRTIRDSDVDELMKRIKEGEPTDEIRRYISENREKFSPHMQDVNQFIAKEFGYEKWHGDGYKEPLSRVLGIAEQEAKNLKLSDLESILTERLQRKDFTTSQMREITRLKNLEMNRRIMINQFSKMTEREFIKYRTDLMQSRMMEGISEADDGFLAVERNAWVDDMSASETRKINKVYKDSEYASELAKLHSKDRIQVVYDMVDRGIFNYESVVKATNGDNPGFQRFINRVIDEMDDLIQKQFRRNYDDLTDGQKTFAMNLALESVQKGTHGVDKALSQRALQEAKRRIKEGAIKAIEKEVTIGHDLLFKQGKETYRGIVEAVGRNADDMIEYTVKIPTSGEIIAGVKPSDVTKVRINKERLSPVDILKRSDVTQYELARKDELIKILDNVQQEITTYTKNMTERRNDVVEFYRTRVREQEAEILKLEEQHQQYSKTLQRDSDEAVDALVEKIQKQEDILANDDALETWVRAHSQADLEVLKDPARYSRRVKYMENPREHGVPDTTMGYASLSGQIYINKQLWDTLSPKDAYEMLKQFEGELKEAGWTGERIRNTLNTSNKKEKTQQFILEHELSHVNNEDTFNALKSGVVNPGDYNDPLIRGFETRANIDALTMVENFDVDKMLREAQPKDSGRLWLDNVASSERVTNMVRSLRARFDEMGLKEVNIGKLTEEQFMGMLDQYVPHILTPDGKDYFARVSEIMEHGSKVTNDMGFGTVYNPYAQSRTIQGKNIEEINEHFRDLLKGKNLFSEDIADIYLQRALKHNELMYDDRYMHEMLNVFGHDIPHDGTLMEGYKAVMNYGMLKKTSHDMASMRLSTKMMNDVGDFIRQNLPEFQAMTQQSGKSLDEFISAQVEQFLKHNYPDSAMKEIYERTHLKLLDETGLPTRILDEEAMPMVELDTNQIQAIRNAWGETYDNYNNGLLRSMRSAEQRGDFARVEEIHKRFDELAKRTAPQIKQVNDIIVDKANQARMLQKAKDKSRFLQMYDKFQHFMKLQQTVVVPSFHMRNKMSNMFAGWMATGRDSVNLEWQRVTSKLAKHDGNMDEIAKLIESNPKWKDRFRPINIDKPHPSLVDALNLNSGQLHWGDVYQLAKQYDVIDSGQFARDIGAGASSQGIFKKLKYERADGTRISLDPTDTANFVGYKLGTNVGTVVENSDRVLIFASQLKQGKSIDEAVRRSKEFLFDYSDLTAFEQSVMKRIFPYYTWLRKNARLQVGQLIEQPEKYRQVAKMMVGIDHMTPQDERMNPAFIGEWAQDWIQLPFTAQGSVEGQREPVIMSPNLPFMDFNRIPDPTNIDESLRGLFSQTSPAIKNTVELGLNKSMFFNNKIAGEDDNMALAYAGHLANQTGAGNIISGFNKDNATDVGLHLVNTVSGVKMNSYDYETSKHMQIQRMLEQQTGGTSDTPIDDFTQSTMKTLIERILDGLGDGVSSSFSKEDIERYLEKLRR